jgi:hypothetical protein
MAHGVTVRPATSQLTKSTEEMGRTDAVSLSVEHLARTTVHARIGLTWQVKVEAAIISGPTCIANTATFAAKVLTGAVQT